MFRINRLNRPVLITVDEVIAKAAVDQGADIRFLMNSIEVAEERFIVPVLGEAFYDDFISKKNVLVTDVNRDDLVAQINESLAQEGADPIVESDLINGMYVNAIELVADEKYKLLWNRYLWKVVAEAVDISSTVPGWLRTTGQGQMMNSPQTIGGMNEGSSSGTSKDVRFKIDSMLEQRLYPLIERMKKYLCDNSSWFPRYDTCGCAKVDGISNKGGGFIFGIYEDSDRRREWE